MSRAFTTQTYGKWILAGEHAVLRGSPALVFPLKNYSMRWVFAEGPQDLTLTLQGAHGEELSLVIWGLIENALLKVGRQRHDLLGHLQISNDLTLGAGLGASAALCVGVAKIFAHKGWVDANRVYEFARDLEGLFHGQSSGVDIAVSLEGVPLKFHRGGDRVKLTNQWSPHFYLSYSGKRGVTSECVRAVMKMFEQGPHLAEKIDNQMREAVRLAEVALQSDADEGFDALARAIDQARDCFYQWGLCDGVVDQHMQMLTAAGAYAVKPTGSGGGGYILSLWKTEAPPKLVQQESLLRLDI
jgi:mevalonate kinase